MGRPKKIYNGNSLTAVRMSKDMLVAIDIWANLFPAWTDRPRSVVSSAAVLNDSADNWRSRYATREQRIAGQKTDSVDHGSGIGAAQSPSAARRGRITSATMVKRGGPRSAGQ